VYPIPPYALQNKRTVARLKGCKMARKHGVSSITDLLPEHLKDLKQEANVTYVARTPLLKVKPISCSDPVLFIKMVSRLQQIYPNLKFYIFKVIKHEL
jgi:hypothetical protein